MQNYLAMNAKVDYNPDPEENIGDSLFDQYERVLVETLITSFGLDFFIKDRHGGDVDTIHNVDQIGKDSKMTYKNKKNLEAYENRGEYNSSEYHSDSRYVEKNREVSQQKKEGTLVDAYTGEKIGARDKSDLDHTISAKEIHDDRKRVLADLSGKDLANSDENLNATNPHTNRTKKADSMDTFLDKNGNEYTEEQKEKMREKDKKARDAYDAKCNAAYYTSPKFAKDVALSAGTLGLQMGARQTIGLLFTEIWFSVKEELKSCGSNFDLEMLFRSIAAGVKKGAENAKKNHAELIKKFLEGTFSGVLSSITTTLCNIFFTTAKNTVKIIRMSYVSIVQATEVLFINPANYEFGDRIKAVSKILATGASVVAGSLVSEAISTTPINSIPVLGNVIQSFCGALVTGVLSCTLLYFIDRSELSNKLVRVLNNIHTLDTEVNYFVKQAEYFEKYAAELMNIDLDQLKKEIKLYDSLSDELVLADSEEELNKGLINALKVLDISIPWKGGFDDFMNDKSAVLVFE